MDSVIRGVNFAIQWEAETVHLKMDSLCVYKWLPDTLIGKGLVRTKATGEMLII